MSAEWLSLLVEGTLATSAALLLVLILRRPLARRFGAGCVPVLWSLVPLAQLAVWLPAPSIQSPATWQVLPGSLAPVTSLASAPAQPAGPDAASVLVLCWALGAFAATAYFLMLQHRFRRRLGRLRPLQDAILEAESSEVGPAVLGVIRPRIVLPADFATRFSTEQQALILAHERSHLRRGDVAANAVATALRCLYWFNPLLHYAASRLRHDHELASDADVVQRYPHARRCYADTLLDVQLAVPGLPVGCLWQSSHPLKERLLMLSSYRSTPRRRTLGTALAIGLSLSAAALAWASQPPRIDVTGAPAWANQKFSLAGQDRTLQQAVDHLARTVGIGLDVTDPIVLERLQAQNGIDYEFNDIEAGVLLDLLLEGTGVQVAYTGDGIRLSPAESPSAPKDPNAKSGKAQPGNGGVGATPAANESGPTYRSLAPPPYPKAALDAGQQGNVILKVLVATDGSPKQVEVASATLPGVFDTAAVEAVRKWKFNPGTRDGQPVETWVQVPLCFSQSEDQTIECSAGPDALDGIYRIAPGTKQGA